MNKTLQKKLLSYSALATALLAVEKSADAQIVYHQVDTVTTDYLLDLNGDGVYDFDFNCEFRFYKYSTVSGFSYTISKVIASGYGYNYNGNGYCLFNKNLRQTSSIANAGSVNSSIVESMFAGSGYLPLKLTSSNGNIYMGWLRLTIDNYSGLIITGYAYDLMPTNSIVLGDSGCAHQATTPVIKLQGADTLISSASNKYQWYLNGKPITTDTTQSLINPEYGLYSVITTDTGGCKTQSSAVNFSGCKANDSTLFITSYNAQSCSYAYDRIQFTKIGPYGFDLNTIQWFGNGKLIQTNGPPNSITETITTNTDFYAVAYNLFTQCYDTSNTVNDSIYPPPSVPLIIQQGDTLFATDNVKEVYIYEWFENGILITNAFSNFYIPGSSGSYTVEIINEGDCDSTSLPYLFTETGINDLSPSGYVKVYTNDNSICINFLTPDFLNGTIELYNIEGQKLIQQTISNSTEILNAQQYTKGIYFISITKNDTRKIYKVVLL